MYRLPSFMVDLLAWVGAIVVCGVAFTFVYSAFCWFYSLVEDGREGFELKRTLKYVTEDKEELAEKLTKLEAQVAEKDAELTLIKERGAYR